MATTEKILDQTAAAYKQADKKESYYLSCSLPSEDSYINTTTLTAATNINELQSN